MARSSRPPARSSRPTSRAGHRPVVVGVLLLATVSAAAGCSSSQDSTASSEAGRAAAPSVAQQNGGLASGSASAGAQAADAGGAVDNPSLAAVNALDASPVETGRKVVSSASLTVKTDDLPATKERAAQVVRSAGGELYQESTSFGARASSVLTLKVPPDAFDEVLRSLGGLGTLAKQDISTEDVTQQVIDLDARTRGAEASVASVQELVGKSTNLIETANLESELQRRIANLESLRGQRQTLEKRIDLSTIVLTLESDTGTPAAEQARAAAPPPPDKGFGDGLEGSLELVGALATAASVAAGALLPFTPVILALVALVRWNRRRRPTRSTTGTLPPPPGAMPGPPPGPMPSVPGA